MDLQNIAELLSQISFRSAAWMIGLPVAFIIADLITGFAQAWINSCIQSRAMRVGIVHKVLEGGIILLMWILQAAIRLPVYHWYTDPRFLIAIWYCFMEAISIAENLSKAGLWVPKFLLHRMQEAKEKIDNGEIEELVKDEK
jgi:toxin secretion/phage lysis holin